MHPNPSADARRRLVRAFHKSRGLMPWDRLIGTAGNLPVSLTPLGAYDVFNTVLLAYEDAASRYWAPRGFLVQHLNVALKPDARPVFIHYIPQPGGRPRSYPVYNLADTVGKAAQAERRASAAAAPQTPGAAASSARSLLQLMRNAPSVDVGAHGLPPSYDVHRDTLSLGGDAVHNASPAYVWRLLTAIAAATAHARRTPRRLFPPLRELFVTSLAASELARNCGFDKPPRRVLPSKHVLDGYVRDLASDLLQAAADAQAAVDWVLGHVPGRRLVHHDYERDLA